MRTQIALDDEQHARAKRKAAELGITMAEYIRILVDRDLGDDNSRADVSEIFGIGSSGGSDIENEQHAIGAAISSHHQR